MSSQAVSRRSKLLREAGKRVSRFHRRSRSLTGRSKRVVDALRTKESNSLPYAHSEIFRSSLECSVGPAEQEISDLIEDGLHEQNLSRLATICEGLSAQSPTLYVTLSLVFRALALEYDGQGVRTQRYEQINTSLQRPLLDLIRSADG